MHRSTQPPELIDAWLPPRIGRNARLERLTELIDWTPLAVLVADLHAAPVRRLSKHHPRLSPAARHRQARIDRVRRPVEHVFGTLKRSHGYQRVSYRGLACTSAEMWFKVLTYNLRRADRLLTDAPA